MTHPIIPILEQRSKFFCAAKWTELYLYLNHGLSNSCHHPIPHGIPEELLDNPSVLHNTPHKLQQQQLMINGERPAECHMCWHIEDSNPDAWSDRYIKSDVWKNYIAHLEVDENFVPPFIEVVFDNVCNLACSYCDSGQSSRWAALIKNQSLELKTDYRNLYRRVHIDPGSTKDHYYQAWQRWWPSVRSQVKTIKVSGGEPLLSKNFWNFLESLDAAPQMNFDINSNLMIDIQQLQRLSTHAGKFHTMTIAASIDGQGAMAEYARQGLDTDRFVNNARWWCENAPGNAVINLQSTVNIFSIWTLTSALDLTLSLREQYGARIQEHYVTIVRFPEFQTVLLMPKELRIMLHKQITDWQSKNYHRLTTNEFHYITKITGYLISDPVPLENLDSKDLEEDLRKFIKYYTPTGSISLDVFPEEFVNWIKCVN